MPIKQLWKAKQRKPRGRPAKAQPQECHIAVRMSPDFRQQLEDHVARMRDLGLIDEKTKTSTYVRDVLRETMIRFAPKEETHA